MAANWELNRHALLLVLRVSGLLLEQGEEYEDLFSCEVVKGKAHAMLLDRGVQPDQVDALWRNAEFYLDEYLKGV